MKLSSEWIINLQNLRYSLIITILQYLRAGEKYSHRIQDSRKIKEEPSMKYKQRLRKIWSSELSGKNQTNNLTVPVVTVFVFYRNMETQGLSVKQLVYRWNNHSPDGRILACLSRWSHQHLLKRCHRRPGNSWDIVNVVGNDSSRICWSLSVHTTRLLQANKPDIFLLDKLAKKI